MADRNSPPRPLPISLPEGLIEGLKAIARDKGSSLDEFVREVCAASDEPNVWEQVYARWRQQNPGKAEELDLHCGEPPMHLDLAHLLHFLKQNPLDDTARLVLADWLEENGDIDGRARAQLIRLQLRLNREPMMAARRPLEAEIESLRLRHLHYWLGDFVGVPGVVGGVFERGLLRLRIRPAIVPEGLARLPTLPDWAWVDGLICDTRWPLGDVTVALMTSPTLAGLRYLNFEEGDPAPGAIG
jgi:uncharacterized protein (TIGR02996 family)